MYIKELAIALALISVYFVLSSLVVKIKRLITKRKGVYYRDFILGVGIGLSLIFSAAFCYGVFYKALHYIFLCLFTVFILWGWHLMINWKNRYIEYDDNGFSYKKPFAFKRHCTYNQITGYAGKLGMDIGIFLGKKRVHIEADSKGVQEFIEFAKSKGSWLYERQSIFYSEDENLVSRAGFIRKNSLWILSLCVLLTVLSLTRINQDSKIFCILSAICLLALVYSIISFVVGVYIGKYPHKNRKLYEKMYNRKVLNSEPPHYS